MTTDPTPSPRSHDPRVVAQLGAVIADAYSRGVPAGSRFGPSALDIAREVLDAMVVDDPSFTWHEDGSISVYWPVSVDPYGDPAEGLRTVLTDARLLARIVQRLNEQAAELARLRQVEAHLITLRAALDPGEDGAAGESGVSKTADGVR